MAVADLYKAQLALEVMFALATQSAERVRVQHATLHHAKSSGARPCHALQKSPAVDAVVVVVNFDLVFRSGKRQPLCVRLIHGLPPVPAVCLTGWQGFYSRNPFFLKN